MTPVRASEASFWGPPVDNEESVEENARCWSSLQGLPGLERVVDAVNAFANHTLPVLIVGESGTGKEFVARALCHRSNRAEKSFVAVNLGGTPPELADSELFGHVRGAFSGADANRKGAFGTVSDGTLFLDEIGVAPFQTQIKLLRVLESRFFRPVGSDSEYRTQARVITATNEDITDPSVFRQDLRFRLDGARIDVPPLRGHPEDIPTLVARILADIYDSGSETPPEITDTAIEVLQAYDWPGNVRELRNVLTRCLASGGHGITAPIVEAALGPSEASRPPNGHDPALVEALADTFFDDLISKRVPLSGIIQIRESTSRMASDGRGTLFLACTRALSLATARYLASEEIHRDVSQVTVASIQSAFGVPRGGNAAFRDACQNAISNAVQEFKRSRGE